MSLSFSLSCLYPEWPLFFEFDLAAESFLCNFSLYYKSNENLAIGLYLSKFGFNLRDSLFKIGVLLKYLIKLSIDIPLQTVKLMGHLLKLLKKNISVSIKMLHRVSH